MHSRSRITALVLALGLQAQAGEVHVDGGHCGFNSNYDVQVTPYGIGFTREGAQPSQVFMHDGTLRVDGQVVSVSMDDATRLRTYEGDMRKLLPEMAGIAQDAIGIAFDSLATVAATLGGSADHRDAVVQHLNQTRENALRQLDAGINADHWSEKDFEKAIERPVTEASTELASSLTRSVLWSLFTGDEDKLQARADSLDQSLDKQMKARADKLEVRAKAICPQLTELEQLQQQFQFRLADGTSLQLITRNKESQNQAGQVAER